VKKIVLHPEYERATKVNDVALVLLEKDFILTDYVRPICLWDDEYDLDRIENKIGVVRISSRVETIKL
jgi:Trypsin